MSESPPLDINQLKSDIVTLRVVTPRVRLNLPALVGRFILTHVSDDPDPTAEYILLVQAANQATFTVSATDGPKTYGTIHIDQMIDTVANAVQLGKVTPAP